MLWFSLICFSWCSDSGIYMLSYAEYYATMPDFPNDELDIATHRSRLALLFYSYGMAKQIHGYESDSDNTAKVPSKKPPTTIWAKEKDERCERITCIRCLMTLSGSSLFNDIK